MPGTVVRTFYTLSNLHNNPKNQLSLFPFHRGENSGTERLSFSKVTQVVTSRGFELRSV